MEVNQAWAEHVVAIKAAAGESKYLGNKLQPPSTTTASESQHGGILALKVSP